VLALLLLLLLLLILRSVAHWGPGAHVATSTVVARIFSNCSHCYFQGMCTRCLPGHSKGWTAA
jgi:hypothetical protein